MNNRLFLEVTPIRRGIEGLRCELLMMRSRSTLLSVGGSYYAGFRVLLLTAGRGFCIPLSRSGTLGPDSMIYSRRRSSSSGN